MWVEYAHNTYTSSATGMFPVEGSLRYTPSLFPSQESHVAVPSVQHHFKRCRRVWRQTKTALLCTAAHNNKAADCHCSSALAYQVGQKVWLPTQNIHLKNTPQKLAPCFIEPLLVVWLINPTAVRLQLPTSIRTHLTGGGFGFWT